MRPTVQVRSFCSISPRCAQTAFPIDHLQFNLFGGCVANPGSHAQRDFNASWCLAPQGARLICSHREGRGRVERNHRGDALSMDARRLRGELSIAVVA